ncbi:MAG: hypothetical protein KJ734_09000, partial [Chloroflexi bacterium]|nr:hypothetical protein [Chloroflexota bacterium]
MNSRTGCQIQRLLPALVLLLLALALLPQTAYVQGLAGPANPRPVTTGSGTIPQTSDPDCDLRPAGQKTLLLAHDEMALAYRANKQPNLAYSAIQEHERKLVWGSPSDFLNTDALSDIRWPSATMADLDGDGRQQIVMAFQDKYQRVATARPISIRPNEPPDYDLWYSDSANCQGKNVAWVGIAAGNLDGPWTQDHDDEVVVAFSDNNHGLHLFTLDKANLDRPNSRAAWYGDDATNGRGSVQYVAVATGDLDGDGYDNEIVTVFKDGNKDLQCVILQQRQGKQTLQVLWWRQWTTHDRHNIANDGFGQNFAHNTQPVDVTTGDVDGDFQDEVILTFRDNNGTC